MKYCEKKYCYKKYLDRILKLVHEENYSRAMQEFGYYMHNYPKDNTAFVYYVDLLIKLGYFKEAKDILDCLKLRSDEVYEYLQSKFMYFKLFCVQKKYKEAFAYLEEYPEILDFKNDLDFTLFFMGQGLCNYSKLENSGSYLFQQINDYDEDRFFRHMKDRRYGEGNALFSSDFPLEDVYYVIQKIIPNVSKIYDSTLSNAYLFKYDCCGYLFGKRVNYFRVIALNGTNKIITMYPYENVGRNSCIDLNMMFLYDEKNLSRVKRRNQIDKFEEKYKI